MNLKNRFYPESRFAGFTNIDGTIAFYSRVNALINPEDTIIDFGCGRGAYQDDPIPFRRNLRILKNKCSRVIGLDIDPEAATNPYIDEFQILESQDWPIESNSVNICICDYVLEHLSDPEVFFSQSHRVLRQGGYLCIRTSNLFSYFGLIAKLLPENSHKHVLSVAKDHLEPKDKFRLLLRCNSIRRIQLALEKQGYQNVVFGYEAEPGYLRFSTFSYWLGVMHQKYAPNFLKVGIFAFAKKV